MTRSQFAELRVHQIGSALGARAPRFSRRMGEQYPFGAEYGAAITKYERVRTPLSDKVLFVVGVIGVIAALAFNNWSPFV